MIRLWATIIYLCWIYGEVEGLNLLVENMGGHYGKTWQRLRWLETRDKRLRVIRHGRGRKMRISYDFDGIPVRLRLRYKQSQTERVITFERDWLYADKHEPSRRLN